jgi:hypothetical protein
MGYKFNPFTGNFDATDSPNGEFESLDVSGDINLDDGGTYETTVQVVTPTANRTISFPDATGTVALVAGSSGQLIWNSSGAQAGVTGSTVDGSGNVTLTSVSTGLGTAGAPTHSFTGDPNTGIYSPGADQVAISTNGTGRLFVDSSGRVGVGTSSVTTSVTQTNRSTATIAAGFALQNSSGVLGGLVGLGAAGSGGGSDNLYLEGTSNLIFAAGGSEKGRITSDGKLGLGTSVPGAKLDVWPAGSDAAFRGNSGISVQVPAFEFRGYNLSTSEAGLDIRTFTLGSFQDRVRITNTGAVGIGTTSPSFDLTIDKDSNSVVTSYTRSYNTGSSAGGRVSAASAVGTIAISAYSAAHSIWPSSTVLNSDSGFTGGLNIYQTGANPIVLWTNDFERARIDSSGRLLVGTSSTTRGGAGDITAQGSSVGAGLRLQTSLTSPADGVGLGYIYYADAGRIESATIGAHRDGGTWASGSSQPTRLVFSTTADGASSPTERMRITSNGHVLLNTSTDLAFFSVVDDTYGASDLFIRTFGASSASFIVRGDGDCENTNNSYGAFSDVKLKENVSDASSQWSDIKALRVRKFNLKTRPSDTHIGLIAQETELVSPGLVSELPDRDEDGNDLGTVTKSVKYSVLYMKAVKALQEAMERIETLETSNADLLARVSVLEQG